MNYKVVMKTKNKMFMIKNKPIRSPFELVVNEDELKLIKSRIKYYGLSEKEYIIEVLSTDVSKKKDYSYIPSKRQPDKKSRIPKTTDSSNPVLNKTAVKNPEKKKIINTTKRKPYKVKEAILNPTQVFSIPEKKEEQIINNKVDGVEVKIEELTIKSTSLLDKFLNLES